MALLEKATDFKRSATRQAKKAQKKSQKHQSFAMYCRTMSEKWQTFSMPGAFRRQNVRVFMACASRLGCASVI